MSSSSSNENLERDVPSGMLHKEEVEEEPWRNHTGRVEASQRSCTNQLTRPPPEPAPSQVVTPTQHSSRFSEADVFKNVVTLEERLGLQDQLESLMNSAGFLPRAQIPPPKLDQVTEQCFRWAVDDDQYPSRDQDASITAVLTSQPLAACLQRYIEPPTIATFRHFLLSATLAHTGWRDQRPPPQRLSPAALHRLSCAAGSALLQRLDDVSSTSPLHHHHHHHHHQQQQPSGNAEPPSRARLQAHFVLTLGTALGVAYSTHWSLSSSPSPGVLDPAHRANPTRWLAMRERLWGLLGRELVALGRALRPDMGPDAQARLERAAMGRWAARHECWTWGNALLSLGPTTYGPTAYGPAHGPEQAVETSGGMFCPAPCAAMVAQPEALGSGLPRPDASDKRKRRSMIVVGPWEGRQLYARMRTHENSGGPRMMV